MALLEQDGAVTCIFALESLENVRVPVDLTVVAPGYRPTLVPQFRGCANELNVFPDSATPTTVALAPISDGGVAVRSVSDARTGAPL